MNKWIRKIKNNIPKVERIVTFYVNYSDIKECNCKVEEIHFSRITDRNCEIISEIRDDRVANAFRNMYLNGEYCLGAFSGGKIIAHCSLILPENCKNQMVVKDSGYIHYCYVAPEYRGKNVYPKMLWELMKQTHEQHGINRFSIHTSPDNYASQRGIYKVGFAGEKNHISVIWRKYVLGKVYV